IKIAAIVLDTRAMSQFLNHFHVVLYAFLNALSLVNMRTSKELASEVVPATIRMMLAGRMGTVVMTAALAAQQVLPASAAPTAP
ncbi:MAG: hypothetical protein J6N98_00480, partial [Prevotella sp.]|nr:hypothetical protein [Prevotella sp.]